MNFRTYTVVADERRFLVRIVSEPNGYSVRVREDINGEELGVPAANPS